MPRRKGTKVLKAISSPLRLKILGLLYDKGSLSYTEIMNILRLSPSRDAGKFAYHLKRLLMSDLIEPEVETKKYRLTDLGRMLIGVTEEIDDRVSRGKKMFVRASRLAIEEFDKNKIAASLLREAGVPSELAQKIARETEKRLLKFKAKYLTAPLIREIVNVILMEKGYEEYRHRLTRLGLPVHDVTQLIGSVGRNSSGVKLAHMAAGEHVIEEYALLKVLPRAIADAHLSGVLHLNNLGCWILKVNEIAHDLRFFLRHGLGFEKMDFLRPSYPPPKNLESALLILSSVLRFAATEVAGEQLIDYFNVFLAPFAKGLSKERIRECLRHFVFDLNYSLVGGAFICASLGLEFGVPNFLEQQEAIGPGGKRIGHYADFIDEARSLNSLLLEVMSGGDIQRAFFNPRLVLKLRPRALQNKESEALLFQSHKLAAEKGLPYFANLNREEQDQASYAATGSRFAADWKGDWELDTLRIGSIGSVMINLPRIAYEAKRKQTRFLEILNKQLEMANRALETKFQWVKLRVREGLLPFLMQKADGDSYFRLENSSRLISFIGLDEMVRSMRGASIFEDAVAVDYAEGVIKYLSQNVQRFTKKPENRTSISMLPNPDAARRLAELDVEKYGWSMVQARRTKEKPSYADLVSTPLKTDIPLEKRLSIEERFHRLSPGGHLAIIQLPDLEQDPQSLLSSTKNIVATYDVGLFVYTRNLAYCSSCNSVFYGILSKCPSCGSVGMMANFSRMSHEYSLVSSFTPALHFALMEQRPNTPIQE